MKQVIVLIATIALGLIIAGQIGRFEAPMKTGVDNAVTHIESIIAD